MSVKENLENIKSDLPAHISLVAVTKTKSVSVIQEAYDAGHRIYGENKVQELVEKQPLLPDDIEWHMIGHVQTNKVKYMASFVALIHGVDSFKLLKEIDKQAQRNNRTINCLIQIKIAQEDSKYGMDADLAESVLRSEELISLKHIKVIGLMGMATFTADHEQIEAEFKYLKSIFDALQKIKRTNCNLEVLSMGMSGDYKLAIANGATMVRIGSSIFGARNY